MFSAFFLIILITLFSSACSGSDPAITDARWRLTAFRDTHSGVTGEYLGLAVLAVDDDGLDDLESISLISDEHELYWQASVEDWVVRQIRQQSWIVLEKLAVPDNVVPRGAYRIILRDYSGAQAESSFSVTASPELPESFPSLLPSEGTGGDIVLDTPRSESILMIRSEGGVLLGSFTLRKGLNSRISILANEQIRSQARELYLYEQGSAGRHSILAGPWSAEDYLFPD
ncbi:MAG: hypothetical protein LBK13_09260 [Spirochaetales bacterium]|jgi:hypothetical protein|nr:hypothetical protein [Spirochaetales bacterium]